MFVWDLNKKGILIPIIRNMIIVHGKFFMLQNSACSIANKQFVIKMTKFESKEETWVRVSECFPNEGSSTVNIRKPNVRLSDVRIGILML